MSPYDGDVVKEEALCRWESSKDPSEHQGEAWLLHLSRLPSIGFPRLRRSPITAESGWGWGLEPRGRADGPVQPPGLQGLRWQQWQQVPVVTRA